MNMSVGTNPPIIAKPQEVPVEALARVEAFLFEDISHIIFFAYLASGSELIEQRGEALIAITKVLHMLYQLRREILRNLPQISGRYHKMKITSKYKLLKGDLGDYIDQIYAELFAGVANTVEEYESKTNSDEKAVPETASATM
jgi:hypothetical protein